MTELWDGFDETVTITSDGFKYELSITRGSNQQEVHVHSIVEGCEPNLVGIGSVNHDQESTTFTIYDKGYKVRDDSLRYHEINDIIELGEWIAGTYWME